MKRTLWLLLNLIGLFLGLFIMANILGIELDTGGSFERYGHSWVTGLLGLSLLIADVLIPVPSSIIMIGLGSIFGVVKGTLLSLGGGLGASFVAFIIGRSGQKWVVRFIGNEEQDIARKWISQWGGLAIILSRPIPILAESFAILAGSTGMSWPRMLFSSTIGLLPICAVYSYVGAFAAQLNSALLSGILVLLSAGLFWGIGMWFKKSEN